MDGHADLKMRPPSRVYSFRLGVSVKTDPMTKGGPPAHLLPPLNHQIDIDGLWASQNDPDAVRSRIRGSVDKWMEDAALLIYEEISRHIGL